ncbi:hypothetical protein FPV67DRAFT_220322 [Lyophyllum atratum]|nr:hypothetical protein FPV67DRAFT_220322 [Lyophyllum atratum]
MPFFEKASDVNIYNGDFKDIAGSHNIYNGSTHNVDSYNTKNETITDSYNDSSVEIGSTENDYRFDTHYGARAAFALGVDQEQSRQLGSRYPAQDPFIQVAKARMNLNPNYRRALQHKPPYDPYQTQGFHDGVGREESFESQEEDAWAPPVAQPRHAPTRVQSAPGRPPHTRRPRTHHAPSAQYQDDEMVRERVTAALRRTHDRRPPQTYDPRAMQEDYPWGTPATQSEPSSASMQPNQFTAPPVSQAQTSPPRQFKSNNPFANMVDTPYS